MRKLLLVLSVSFLAGCERTDLAANSPNATGFSTAYNRWEPSTHDTCTEERHNEYSVTGPDGLVYPTWHAAVDEETGCTFGHDHGRDPRGSALYGAVGPIPFGYANEMLAIFNPTITRHEDHVGHKVEWENDVILMPANSDDGSGFPVQCDMLTKLHQGTHSKDAFTNNLHEWVYHLDCGDGTKMDLTLMASIGKAGEFIASCDSPEPGHRVVVVGPPDPINSPNGLGRRIIPDQTCIDRDILVPSGQTSSWDHGMKESWEVSQIIETLDNRELARMNPYYQVLSPSRYYDPSAPDGVRRPVDLCYANSGGLSARGTLCDESTANGQITDIAHDDPQSRFNGAHRFVDVNANQITNLNGPEVWYTDPLGRSGSVDPFDGSIRQFLSQIDNSKAARGFGSNGPQLGRERDYGRPGVGVHAPN